MERKPLTQAGAILLAALLFCTTFAVPFAKAEEAFPVPESIAEAIEYVPYIITSEGN